MTVTFCTYLTQLDKKKSLKIVKKVKYVIPVDYFWLISKGIKGRIKLMRDATQKLSKRVFMITVVCIFTVRSSDTAFFKILKKPSIVQK